MSAAVETLKPAAVSFPSRAWFQQLANLMNANRTRQEQLGYVDCIAQFTVLDGGPDGGPLSYRVTFEEFSAIAVEETASRELGDAHFGLEGSHATWREMIDSIVDGNGRPDLEHSLNRLSHMGTPLKLVSTDPVQADYFFRFNQSLQEFVNACAQFTTVFGR
jgi:hypothetical protein